jgi:threonine/homoserine/homoserine lactone efflux protein
MDLWLPLATFAFIASITPGPNNAMLSASGVVFGFKRTIPHLLGVWVGFALLLALCGGGIGAVIGRFPELAAALRVVGSAYLLWLAWTMRSAFEPRQQGGSARPLAFREAVAFQFVNPKAWVMGITAAAVFAPNIEPRWIAIASMCAVFALVNLPCICSWAALGATLRRWLTSARRRRAFGGVVALLMGYSVVAIWM